MFSVEKNNNIKNENITILEEYNSTTGKVIDWHSKKRNNLIYSNLLWNVYDKSFKSCLDGQHNIYTYYDSKEKKIFPLVSKKICHRVKYCAQELTYMLDKLTGEKKLLHVYFCKHRLCPLCNWRKSLKLFGQTSIITNEISKRYSNYGYLFLTLTIKNCKCNNIRQTINDLNKGYQKLLGKKHLKRYDKLHYSLKGSMKFIEITYNKKRDDYHVHIHAILCVDNDKYKGRNYISHLEIQDMWKSAMNLDYKPMVNIKRIKTVEKANAVAEVSKYPIKSDFMLSEKMSKIKKIEVLAILLKQLKGKRFISYYGIFSEIRKELSLDDIENGDLINVDGKETKIEDLNYNNISYELYKFNCALGVYCLSYKK